MDKFELSKEDKLEAERLVKSIKHQIGELHAIMCRSIGVEVEPLEQFEFVTDSHGKVEGLGHGEPTPDWDSGKTAGGYAICNKQTHKGVMMVDPPGYCRPITC